MTTGIYQIENHTRCQLYIGSSVDVERRLKQHQKALVANSHSNRILRQWSQSDVIQFKIIHSYGVKTTRRYLLALEESYIAGFYEGWQLVNLSKPLQSTDFYSKETLCQHLATGYPIYHLSHDVVEISYELPHQITPRTFLCLPALKAFCLANRGYLHLLSQLLCVTEIVVNEF